MAWSLSRSWVRDSRRSLRIAGHLSKCVFFLSSVCIGSLGDLELASHMKQIPWGFAPSCLLEALGAGVMAAVGQGSLALAALEEELWLPAPPPELGRPCSPPPATQKGQETKYLGNWVLKILPSGGANISPCETPPRCIFPKGRAESAKREEKGPVPPSPWGRARGRQSPGCRTPHSGFYTPHRLKPFWHAA